MLSLWRCHCLSDGNPPITTKCPKVLYALKFWQSWGHVGWKKALYGYTCLFLFLCIYCGDSCQLSISAVYAWNPQHSLMQTKATISLENREKLEGVKSTSWVEVGLSFLQTWLLQFWCANHSLTMCTHYFSSRCIIHSPNRNITFIGAWMISFGFGFRGVHVFITIKSGNDVTISKHENALRTQQSTCYCYCHQHI